MIHQTDSPDAPEERPRALVEFHPDDYISAFWCIPMPPQIHPPAGGDVLMVLWRPAGEPLNRWKFVQRHRYSHPEDVMTVRWPSRDRTSSYHYTGEGSEEQFFGKCRQVMQMIAMVAGQRFDDGSVFEVHGDAKRMRELIEQGKAPSWFHRKAEAQG